MKPGRGGEYDVQSGFGWTNGVILDLLHTYGERLTRTTSSGCRFVTNNSFFIVILLSSVLSFGINRILGKAEI